MDQNLFKKVEELQDMLVNFSTGGGFGESDYESLRQDLLSNPLTKYLIPDFVKKNRNLSQFWSFIKHKFDHYQERREFLWGAFSPLLEKLEFLKTNPISDSVDGTLKTFDIENVSSTWSKITRRREEDPEGAITAARTMLEDVCKYVLEELKVEHPAVMDLPDLYKLVAKNLSLAPEQHTEKIFKQILGGAQSVVQGLAAMRNKLGDAHGKGRGGPKPQPRHAELAINMAGTLSVFLLETLNTKTSK